MSTIKFESPATRLMHHDVAEAFAKDAEGVRNFNCALAKCDVLGTPGTISEAEYKLFGSAVGRYFADRADPSFPWAKPARNSFGFEKLDTYVDAAIAKAKALQEI